MAQHLTLKNDGTFLPRGFHTPITSGASVLTLQRERDIEIWGKLTMNKHGATGTARAQSGSHRASALVPDTFGLSVTST